MKPEDVVRLFWDKMATNDFYAAGVVLAEDFVMEWPQSGERIRGAERFARMNSYIQRRGHGGFV